MVAASGPLRGPNAVPGELDLAEDAAGDAVVAWTEGVAPDRVVRVRTRAAGGAWSTADTLSDPAADSSEPTVGIDGAGNVVALWVTDEVAGQPSRRRGHQEPGRCVVHHRSRCPTTRTVHRTRKWPFPPTGGRPRCGPTSTTR